MKRRKVYVDLDECLINTHFKDNHTVINKEFEYWDWILGDNEVNFSEFIEAMVTYIRPYSIEFLSELRDMFGYENVFLLTASIEEYALKINQHFGLGFPPLQVISREYFLSRRNAKFRDIKENPILIDNQNRQAKNAQRKIDFLGGDDPFYLDYYQIEDFVVWDGMSRIDSHHEREFKKILEKIKKKNNTDFS